MHGPPAPAPPDAAAEREFVARLLAEHERQAHAGQLTAAEILAVREMLEGERRWKWVFASIKTWALWIAALAAGATVGLEALRTAIKTLATG